MSFPRWIRELGKVYRELPPAIFIEIPLSGLEDTMKDMRRHGITVVNAISGYDSGKDMEVLYHFIHAGMVLTLRVVVNRDNPSVPSVAGLFPSAALFESENHEMLGIDFRGNPSLKPVLFSPDTPKTPLRKKDAVKPSKPGTR